MPVDKSTRKSRHEHAPTANIKNTEFPSPKEGAEGQTTFREVKGSVKQLVKKDGRWKEVT